VQLQQVVWVAVYLIIFFSILSEDGPFQALLYTTINVTFYLLVIYGNIRMLFPRLYEKGHIALYVIAVILLLVGGGLGRGYLMMYISNTYFPMAKPETMQISNMIYFVLSGTLTYLLSFVFRIAIAYFSLKQQSEKILAQKTYAELNIYYEAYREAPRTAGLIERLSDIMRYFVDESPKDEVSMQTEVSFIENYIALEKIRIRHKTDISFVKEYSAESRIPPMLLMTFVENVFKHGIDKSSKENKIEISLIQQEGYLLFQTCNRIHDKVSKEEPHGFGIENLRKRLIMLYGTKFELNIEKNGGHTYTAFLKVPIS
jgi:hypothetical protein